VLITTNSRRRNIKMTFKKKTKAVAEVKVSPEPEVALAPEVEPEVALAPEVEPEVALAPEPEPEVSQAPPPESEFIMVRAVGSNQYEPFQRIAIPTDYGVPVKRSNWVTAQLQAGIIIHA
jgi:hypothetical protein